MHTGSGFEFDVSVLDGSSVSGLAIYGFPDEGILIDPRNRGGLAISNCHIGINAAGDRAILNPYKTPDDGILDENTPGILISHNVISGNAHDRVEILGPCAFGFIENNLIGTDATGTQPIGNQLNGIGVGRGATGSVVRQNVLSGNGTVGRGGSGIFVHHTGTNGNRVEGNFIGTDVTGTLPVPNAYQGVAIAYGASGNTVGGTNAMARNIISGNQLDGVFINNNGANFNVVEGNYIGTDVTGTQSLGNRANGVELFLGVSNNTIGGTTGGAAKLISGNVRTGIIIVNTGTTGNLAHVTLFDARTTIE